MAICLALIVGGCESNSASGTAVGPDAVKNALTAPASKLHGSWDIVLPNGVVAVATFNSDGTHMFVADNPAAPAMKIKMSGTYREEGDKIFLTWKDIALENTPAEAKAKEPEMLDGLKKQLQVGVEQQTSVAWESDSAFKTTSPTGNVTTFKKK